MPRSTVVTVADTPRNEAPAPALAPAAPLPDPPLVAEIRRLVREELERERAKERQAVGGEEYVRVTVALPLTAKQVKALVQAGELEAHKPKGRKFYVATRAAIRAYVERSARAPKESGPTLGDPADGLRHRLGLASGGRR